ncbi:type II secretion system protein [Anatilimnocola sp. NA78]|uniref:type II secretion system protein n=1 Tax=Anatilimnocola sp. NA78 TaxID=3415683 RepID=UPI003CE44A8A
MNQQQPPTTSRSPQRPARAFTVIELLVVMLILGLLVAMSLTAFNSAMEQSRVSRTKAIIAKLDSLIMEKWESYHSRSVPIKPIYLSDPTNKNNVRLAARNRLFALRELMRCELPHCQEDVQDAVSQIPSQPALTRAYNRKAPSGTWTSQWEEAECLYLIISCMRDGERSALEFFTADEIGDIDGDGVKEILDGWGQPIMFLRWAPGYAADATTPALSMQSADTADSFDRLKVDSRSTDMDTTNNTFDLKPLIYSFGPDRDPTGIQLPDGPASYDPFKLILGKYIGTISDSAAVADNISNHYQEAE